MRKLIVVFLLFVFTQPCFSYGKYLEWYMKTWTVWDQAQYAEDPNGMAGYVMYLDETDWNLC